MTSLWLAAAIVVVSQAAPTATSNLTPVPPRTPQQLRVAVSSALRHEAAAQGAEHEQAVRELLALHAELLADTKMIRDDRLALRALVRNRLMKVSDALAKRPAPPAAANARVPEGNGGVLAQAGFAPQAGGVPGFGGQNAGNQPKDNGKELVELIQDTISPTTWDVNGGIGVIRYFSHRQVLVITQTDDVHGNVRDLVEQLNAAP